MDEGPGKWISPSDGALLSIAVNVYTNRMNGASYDIAGNVTWDGVHTFQYDPFGQPREISESGGLIVYPIYDADGERIGLVTEGSNEWKWTPRDLGGKVAREYVGLGGSVGQPQNFFYVWKEDYVYRGGLLAGAVREMAEGGLRHFHLDHLGTPRVTTSSSGAVMSLNDYYPFGQEITSMRQQIAAGYDRDDPMKFTGHERDFIGGTYTENADNLDYMHAREYSAGLGRMLQVDPVTNKGAMKAPQLWNRYSYVGNDPVNLVDPDGRLLRLSGCATNTSSAACKAQFNLYLSTFGNQSSQAAQYLTIGKGGIVSFSGISGGAFAAKFGLMGRATNMLVSNRAATFRLMVGRSAMIDAHKGGYCDCYSGADKSFGVDPGRSSQMLAGVLVNTTETLVHETGHAVASLIPGIAFKLGQANAKSYSMKMYDGNYEGYATAFENVWRHTVLGDSNSRTGYIVAGDEYDTTDIRDLFP